MALKEYEQRRDVASKLVLQWLHEKKTCKKKEKSAWHKVERQIELLDDFLEKHWEML